MAAHGLEPRTDLLSYNLPSKLESFDKQHCQHLCFEFLRLYMSLMCTVARRLVNVPLCLSVPQAASEAANLNLDCRLNWRYLLIVSCEVVLWLLVCAFCRGGALS